MNETQTYTATEVMRLDTFLSKELGQTRNQIAQLIKQAAIDVDGKKVAKAGLKLKINQTVSIIFPEAKVTEALDIDFDVDILFEDDDLLIINKPSGLTVHPAPSVKEATLVDWLKHKGIRLSTISGEERHGIVHRLDRGTSGAMVVAKNNETHEALSLQLQDKTMGRYYSAVIEPPMKEELTEIECPIARSGQNRLKMACLEHGKPAKTQFKKLLLSKDEKNELIACKLFTGRTHQIRVHLDSISRHILGDHLYGFNDKKGKMDRILLHAYLLYFSHPRTGKMVRFLAPIPKDMQSDLNKLFTMEQFNEVIDQDHFESYFSSSVI